jgi:adenosine deaminase
MAESHGLDPAGVVDAVVDGVTAGRRDFDQRVNLIGILSRTYGVDIAWKELEALLHRRDAMVGLDLAGDEANWPGELFVKHLLRAREAGWHITVHAGEADGAASIWQALRELGAERIGHAVAAEDDPALMDYMADRQVGVEANLTSNVQTRTVPDYASHPARTFLERGMLVTLNTDDPGISGIDLRYEYEVAAPAAGLSPDQIRQAQRNALTVAFLPEAEKATLVAEKAG